MRSKIQEIFVNSLVRRQKAALAAEQRPSGRTRQVRVDTLRNLLEVVVLHGANLV